MCDARTPACSRARWVFAFVVLLGLIGVGRYVLPGSIAVAGEADTDARARPLVYVIPLEDAVGPVTAHFVCGGIARAEKEQAAAAVIMLDTPGGLDASMRVIVKSILGASIPVIVYVAPPGARAASAGMFIALAAPIVAMAPGTNLGAATPVSLGGQKASPDSTMNSKVVNDAAAYARSLAERHGRNARWAESAVRHAASLSSEEALADSVIDMVCSNLGELLERVDGRMVPTAEGSVRLRTRGAEERWLRLSGREQVMGWITNPSIAYLLFLAGILGLALELYHPGAVLPGVVGGICIILAFFAFQNLPVRAAGILLILLSMVLLILEVKVTSYGVLALGGVTSLVLGSLFLFESGSELRVSLAVVVPAVLTFAAFFLLAAYLVGRSMREPKQGGAEGMIGEIGQAVSDVGVDGRVLIRGEYWNARSPRGIRAGSKVRVVRLQGLLLYVEPEDEGSGA